MTTLYIIEFGNVLINEDPSDIDDVDSIWFGVMSYDTGIDFEERLICSKTKKKQKYNLSTLKTTVWNCKIYLANILLCIKMNT